MKKLIKSGYNALKPGGIIVYSTCTINKAENEEIVKWALENFNLKQEKIDLKVNELKIQKFLIIAFRVYIITL